MSQRPDISGFGKFRMSGGFFFSENCMFVAIFPVVSLVKGCPVESSTLDKPFELPKGMKMN